MSCGRYLEPSTISIEQEKDEELQKLIMDSTIQKVSSSKEWYVDAYISRNDSLWTLSKQVHVNMIMVDIFYYPKCILFWMVRSNDDRSSRRV